MILFKESYMCCHSKPRLGAGMHHIPSIHPDPGG